MRKWAWKERDTVIIKNIGSGLRVWIWILGPLEVNNLGMKIESITIVRASSITEYWEEYLMYSRFSRYVCFRDGEKEQREKCLPTHSWSKFDPWHCTWPTGLCQKTFQRTTWYSVQIKKEEFVSLPLHVTINSVAWDGSLELRSLKPVTFSE